MKDLMDMKSLPKFGAVKKNIRRKTKGSWDKATEKAMRRHKDNEDRKPSYSWVAVFPRESHGSRADREPRYNQYGKRVN
jgi:hypothetical protein